MPTHFMTLAATSSLEAVIISSLELISLNATSSFCDPFLGPAVLIIMMSLVKIKIYAFHSESLWEVGVFLLWSKSTTSPFYVVVSEEGDIKFLLRRDGRPFALDHLKLLPKLTYIHVVPSASIAANDTEIFLLQRGPP